MIVVFPEIDTILPHAYVAPENNSRESPKPQNAPVILTQGKITLRQFDAGVNKLYFAGRKISAGFCDFARMKLPGTGIAKQVCAIQSIHCTEA